MTSVRDHKLLEPFAGIPVSSDVLLASLSEYASPHDKISSLIEQGLLRRLRRDLYVVTSELFPHNSSPLLIANHLYGPSYVSFETALTMYSLIPEHVFATRSMTPKWSRSFSTPLGEFSYTHCPPQYYALGISQHSSEFPSALIARPEKAVCDLIVKARGIRIQSERALLTFLEDDIRLDIDALATFDLALLQAIAQSGYKQRELGFLLEVINHV